MAFGRVRCREEGLVRTGRTGCISLGMKSVPPRRAKRASVALSLLLTAFTPALLTAEEPPAATPVAEESPAKGMMERLQRRLTTAGEQGESALLTRLGEIGAQLAEVRQAALGNTAAMDQMRRDIDQLKQEIATMKRLSSAGLVGGATGSATPAGAVPGGSAAAGLTIQAPNLQPGLVITAVELAEAYAKDTIGSDKQYRDNFLTVVGRVDSFTTGSTDGDLMVQMRTGEGLPRVKLYFNRDIALPVEVRPHEGRIVWSDSKTTLLQMGQQVVISGTCTGRELDVILNNCRVEGLPKPPPPPLKASPTPRSTPRATSTPRPRPATPSES
jgi:hypothetical protein